MLTVLFEVLPASGQMERYLDIAAALRPRLDASGGCLFIDRFRSQRRPGWLLSYQVWADEASLARWRVNESHHEAQTLGRSAVFDDYRLRVAQIVRDEVPGKPAWQAQRLNIYNDPARRAPRFLMVLEADRREAAGQTLEFESIYRPGQFAGLVDVQSYAQALDEAEQCRVDSSLRIRIAEVERDYGRTDRGEAPTYYPAVAPAHGASHQ